MSFLNFLLGRGIYSGGSSESSSQDFVDPTAIDLELNLLLMKVWR